MPNHIINIIRLTGDRQKISELLESVKDNRFGIGSLHSHAGKFAD